MRNGRAFVLCLVMAVLLSLVFLPDALRMLPLAKPTVRAAGLRAMTELQAQGYWATLARLGKITEEEGRTCFEWKYTYRSRTHRFPERDIHTCIDE